MRLLHKAGVAGGVDDGAFAIRGLLAPALIKVLDGDGDGKLGAAELQAKLSTLPCVHPTLLQLEKLEAAGTASGDGEAVSSLDSMLADARACPGATIRTTKERVGGASDRNRADARLAAAGPTSD